MTTRDEAEKADRYGITEDMISAAVEAAYPHMVAIDEDEYRLRNLDALIVDIYAAMVKRARCGDTDGGGE